MRINLSYEYYFKNKKLDKAETPLTQPTEKGLKETDLKTINDSMTAIGKASINFQATHKV